MSPFAKAISRLSCGYSFVDMLCDGYYLATHPKKQWLRIYYPSGRVLNAKTAQCTDGSKALVL